MDEKNFRLILGDGAHWIWILADLLFPGVPQLLDFYHAAEHLYATAKQTTHRLGSGGISMPTHSPTTSEAVRDAMVRCRSSIDSQSSHYAQERRIRAVLGGFCGLRVLNQLQR
ncbi:MAG: hypothetical protein ACREDR_22805 [Blastocatellia bacterium]